MYNKRYYYFFPIRGSVFRDENSKEMLQSFLFAYLASFARKDTEMISRRIRFANCAGTQFDDILEKFLFPRAWLFLHGKLDASKFNETEDLQSKLISFTVHHKPEAALLLALCLLCTHCTLPGDIQN